MCGCEASVCGKEGGPSGDSVRQCPFNMSCLPALEDQGPDVLVFRPEPF